jgi:hypothetical protein
MIYQRSQSSSKCKEHYFRYLFTSNVERTFASNYHLISRGVAKARTISPIRPAKNSPVLIRDETCPRLQNIGGSNIDAENTPLRHEILSDRQYILKPRGSMNPNR